MQTAKLTGDTYMVRGILQQAGWRWDTADKCYVKQGEWRDAAHVIDRVRALAGIRNRGTFRAEIAPR